MPRFKLSEDYYHRKCYLEREQVPTQSVMRNKMRSLAPVYFQSMIYKLKVLAGLEPPLRGGGLDWYQPPTEILAGRHVLQPVDIACLRKLSHNGITELGIPVAQAHLKSMDIKKLNALAENDVNWKQIIQDACEKQWRETAAQASERNSRRIMRAFEEFKNIYKSSIIKVEDLLLDGAIKEIETFEKQAWQNMMERFRVMLKHQSTQIYDEYTDIFNAKKAEIKANFISDVYKVHKEQTQRCHDINVEKHTAIEKLRHLLECEKLACQVYVAHKERQACTRETDLATHEFNKKIKQFNIEIALQEVQIGIEIEKEMERQEFKVKWKNKICHVVKKFQIFVQYCLQLMPEYAEFFINMEKLMMLQLARASTTPSAESIIEPEVRDEDPVAHPHPYFFFREPGFYPALQEELCPKHCTSSASQLPVVVFGKRCMYAACDNIEQFTEKVQRYVSGDRGDVEDLHNYEFCLPVKVTESIEVKEIKMQGSLMRILQQEKANVHNVPVSCSFCDIPHCFCSPRHASEMELMKPPPPKLPSIHSLPSGSKIETRKAELKHDREPKWESYIEFIRPKKCECPKTAKKHLLEHLPPYMRTRSKFEAAEIPNYVPCTVDTIRKDVRRAKGKRSPPAPTVVPPPRTKDVNTQYEDVDFIEICTCISDTELNEILGNFQYQFIRPSKFNVVDGNITAAHLSESPSKFAMKQAMSLRSMLKNEPELQEIFKSLKCDPNKKK